jgi:hypothetical protein
MRRRPTSNRRCIRLMCAGDEKPERFRERRILSKMRYVPRGKERRPILEGLKRRHNVLSVTRAETDAKRARACRPLFPSIRKPQRLCRQTTRFILAFDPHQFKHCLSKKKRRFAVPCPACRLDLPSVSPRCTSTAASGAPTSVNTKIWSISYLMLQVARVRILDLAGYVCGMGPKTQQRP